MRAGEAVVQVRMRTLAEPFALDSSAFTETLMLLEEDGRGDTMTHPLDEVVLLADDGRAIGTAPRASVHDAATPLHFAFSCYVFDAGSRVLLTRRALVKLAWPGVWTNSFCGHPALARRSRTPCTGTHATSSGWR
jgi:hypothetical protein